MIIETGRFGELGVEEGELISMPQGIIGFPDYKRFCLVDPGDDTLIQWLQSLDSPEIAFPVLEPKVFKMDYAVRLSAVELRELKLENINHSAVLSILTIPEDVTQMTANLKAPLVINLKAEIAKQVVLQENEYSIKHPMFKELRVHLMTLRSYRSTTSEDAAAGHSSKLAPPPSSVVPVKNIPPSLAVKNLF